MENEILKKSDGVLREIVAVKYAWIEEQHGCYPVEAMCRVLSVSPSGLATWKRGGQGRTRLADVALLVLIRTIHTESKRTYGWPRVWKELQGQGIPAGKERVRRLMQEHGLRTRHTRRYKATTDPKPNLPVAPNRLNRQFETARPSKPGRPISLTSRPGKAGCT